mmetsp:Transcript_152258/g.265411  ORF Transcript_152258/g.265411 Transcript_152258/m.265411 type:complete len:282 (+) Transcript_152258:1941-2786(+)
MSSSRSRLMSCTAPCISLACSRSAICACRLSKSRLSPWKAVARADRSASSRTSLSSQEFDTALTMWITLCTSSLMSSVSVRACWPTISCMAEDKRERSPCSHTCISCVDIPSFSMTFSTTTCAGTGSRMIVSVIGNTFSTTTGAARCSRTGLYVAARRTTGGGLTDLIVALGIVPTEVIAAGIVNDACGMAAIRGAPPCNTSGIPSKLRSGPVTVTLAMGGAALDAVATGDVIATPGDPRAEADGGTASRVPAPLIGTGAQEVPHAGKAVSTEAGCCWTSI